jgi:hypothetical protein
VYLRIGVGQEVVRPVRADKSGATEYQYGSDW